MDLSEYINHLQSEGRYSFTKVELMDHLDLGESTLRKALWRLDQKNRIRMIRRGFYIIIPLEYSRTAIIPAEWFISDLMKFLELPYYVGLLSAAVIHGASHQQPQEFQVVIPKTERDILIGGMKIRFFKKANMLSSQIVGKKTPTGYMHVSTPSVTAIDLVAYANRVGGLDRILTVLQELSETMTPDSLVEAVKGEKHISHVQRLGWLLEQAGQNDLLSVLTSWISKKNPKRTPLDPALPRKGFPRNRQWNVIINTDVQGEL